MSKGKISSVDIINELQNFVAEFFDELDNNGMNIKNFYFEDGVFSVGGQEFKGHAAVSAFYADRLARVRVEREDAVRTSRHTFVNLRTAVEDEDHARLNFINITYAGDGRPPVAGLVGPSVISDCRMECQRDVDGRWRLKLFAGEAIFIGADPLMNKLALRN